MYHYLSCAMITSEASCFENLFFLVKTMICCITTYINFWLELRKCPFQVLTGNVDTTSHSKSLLDPPIHTRVVRIVPHSQQPRIVCLRFELFGCPNVVDAKDRYGHQRFHFLNTFFWQTSFSIIPWKTCVPGLVTNSILFC